MLFHTNTASLAVAALLCSSLAAASRRDQARFETRVRRDEEDSSDALPDVFTDQTLPPAILEPVVPPETKEEDLSVLDLDRDLTLAWAGIPGGAAPGNHTKRDAAVLTQGDFIFTYPAVALDHSSLITKVSCPGGKLTAVMTEAAYNYAKAKWASAKTILLVTGVDGCGIKDANEYFKATSITFSDKDRSIVAQGVPVHYADVLVDMKLQWGDAGGRPLKRAVDKRDLFEARGLEARKFASFTVSWSAYLNDKWALGTDPDAPWDNAARLYKWSSDGGKPDNSRKKGKAKAKQTLKSKNKPGPRSLESRAGRVKPLPRPKPPPPSRPDRKAKPKPKAEEGESGIGLALYCVECGVRGKATVWGEIEASILNFNVKKVMTGIKADVHAGLTLGIDAYVKYDKSWSRDFSYPLPGGFKIPMLVEVGPFLGFGVEAKANIDATGQLLIGGNVDWNDVDLMIDLLDNRKSYARGFKPEFTKRIEAEGELKASASLGLPMKLGVGIKLAGKWKAEAALKDTPSINAEGKFKGEYSRAADGTVTAKVDGDACYGIDYNVFLGNNVEAYMTGKAGNRVWPLMDPWKGPPIAQGCIGYVPEPPAATTATSATSAEAAQPTEPPPCSAVRNPRPAQFSICDRVENWSRIWEHQGIGNPTKEVDLPTCALKCLKEDRCLSFSFSNENTCQMNYVSCLDATYYDENPMFMSQKYDKDVYVFDIECWKGVPCK